MQELLKRGAELYGRGQSAAAAEIYRKALSLAPRDPTVRLRHALAIWHGENRTEEALQEIADLTKSYPQASVFAAQALVLNSIGRFAEGAGAARKAVSADPLHTTSWLDLATATPSGGAQALALEIDGVLARPDLGRAKRRDLHFARAVCLRKLGDLHEAFTETECANGFETSRWDFDRERQFHGLLREVFTPALIERLRDAGHPDDRMVFVMGMPRSGTTLLEQMLTAHPRIDSVGETPIVGNLFQQLQQGARSDSTAIAKALNRDLLGRIAEALLKGIAARAGGAKAGRIIDKMPANTLFMPFIALLLPNAKIIHLRRHPLDTCLSCYEASFAFGLDYASHQVSLGAAYRHYADLTDHWTALLGGRVLDIRYEHLVDRPEQTLRRALDHCGLMWDPACLAPKPGGLIKTASVAQARGTLSAASVGRWRPLEARLQPLIRAMGGMAWIDAR